MGFDKPDWYTSVILHGKYNSDHLPILVDEDGALISLLKGTSAISGEIGVNQLDSVREMQGENDGGLITIAVDGAGNIISVMKGDFSGALKTIAVDTDGIMKANLSAQALDFLTVRPSYGESVRKAGYEETVVEDEEATLITVAGRGAILGGQIRWSMVVDAPGALFGRVYTENSLVCNTSVLDLYNYNIREGNKWPLFVAQYDPTSLTYSIGISPGTTFETDLDIKVYNDGAETLEVWAELFYALVPD